ncbi:cAMP-binding protein [Owenweeksia hongkongensis DSM 17368]|uniref:cAMP-binding protein n=1 Tax=Owenweeksia hongkongensis (strain DSM 17368 / CIP 108786 / JCM 12287 / NRRL B-23963 / UST20020801) TaxID=926562 RepID=G8R6G0_OWEHD|nr:Crp/Fnr family transcriptional regulator [Owenweeksia hongkongensis]AEV34423.1 cAMP-binding protein [Owenweeksia hongkongensis DSM 17368]
MIIEEKILVAYGATRHIYKKDAVIFEQGDQPRFYFELINGEVKICSLSEEGKEFIQRIFSAGRCFGEPPLFGEFGYPGSAIALNDVKVWQLPKAGFYQLINDHPKIHFEITRQIANRLHYKAMMAQEISHEAPRHRIMRLLNYLKHDIYEKTEKFNYQVELTRQQIADLTGLRVETAIRAIKKLEKEGEVRIDKRKIWV